MFGGEIELMKNVREKIKMKIFLKYVWLSGEERKLMVGPMHFLSWSTKWFSSQNKKKIERKKYIFKIHFQVSYVLAFYFFLSFFLLCYRRVDSSFFFSFFHFSLIFFSLLLTWWFSFFIFSFHFFFFVTNVLPSFSSSFFLDFFFFVTDVMFIIFLFFSFVWT